MSSTRSRVLPHYERKERKRREEKRGVRDAGRSLTGRVPRLADCLRWADGNSHAGPHAGKDEEGDVLECGRWTRPERVGEQQGGVEADIRGGGKEDHGEPVERLVRGVGVSSVSSGGSAWVSREVDTHDDRCHRPILDDLCRTNS
jgi:hypothetical protein